MERKPRHVVDKDDVTALAVTESITHFHCSKWSQENKTKLKWRGERKKRKKASIESVDQSQHPDWKKLGAQV